MKNSLLAIFAKIWPITLYYSTGALVRFLKIQKNLTIKNLSVNTDNTQQTPINTRNW